MRVAVILPVYGRHEQTLRNAARLRKAAGKVDALWVAVGGPDERRTLIDLQGVGWSHVKADRALTYWEALNEATRAIEPRDAPLLCAVANDLLPGPFWLAHGLAAYRARFGDGPGMLGFNGDGHGPDHSCHFLLHRDLLDAFGGWPTRYRHNFGDTELCQRAQELGRYAKAPWAILYHDHVNTGAADDAVYAAGRSGWDADERLFKARRASGWAS